MMNQLAKGGTHRLLVVDDDPETLEVATIGLRNAGFEVSPAASGQAALALAQKERFDLALVDMRMPVLSGAELARRLLADFSCFSLIFSGNDHPDLVMEAIEDGALGYLLKPFDVKRMQPTILAAILRARELNSLIKSHEHLQNALLEGRETSMAVGILIERLRLDRDSAFERLREQARHQRRKVSELAQDILKSAEALNLHAKG